MNTSVPSQMELDVAREHIATACKSSLTLSNIDRLFLQSGCHQGWWTAEGYFRTSSERFNRVNGWIEGIRKNAPDQERTVLITVCEMALADPMLDYYSAGKLKSVLERLHGVVSAPSFDLQFLDTRVVEASGALFTNGHYKEAAREAIVALVAAVRDKSGKSGGMDKDAMIQAFKEDGLLRLSDDRNEQQGYMYLFAGAVSAIRNPLSHVAGSTMERSEALECLTLASLLFRYLDRAVPR